MALIAIGLAAFSFFRAAKPKLRKKHMRKGGNTHSIILELKNPFYHKLRNVMVRDWVSPLASVMHEEISSTKPVIRKSEAGTELVWRLGNMLPREERILNYKIKTLIQGSLKMPRAYARFDTDKGKKFKIYSKPLIVK